MNETEFKALITAEQYKELTQYLSGICLNESGGLQINYLYDTEDFVLNAKGITARIRQKDQELKLEMKTYVKYENGVRESLELSEDITGALPLVLCSQEHKLVKQIEQVECIKLIGVFVTERVHYEICNGISIDLDKNLYLGHLDYELEIEFQESVRSHALGIIAQITSSFLTTYESKGKRRRFFERFNTLKLN